MRDWGTVVRLLVRMCPCGAQTHHAYHSNLMKIDNDAQAAQGKLTSKVVICRWAGADA